MPEAKSFLVCLITKRSPMSFPLLDLQPDVLNRLLKFTNLYFVGTELQKRVIENAKRYCSDERFHNAVNEVVAQQAVNSC